MTSDYPPQPPLCPPLIQPQTANDLVLQNEIPEDYVQQQEDITIETPNAPPVHDPGQQDVVNPNLHGAEELIAPRKPQATTGPATTRSSDLFSTWRNRCNSVIYNVNTTTPTNVWQPPQVPCPVNSPFFSFNTPGPFYPPSFPYLLPSGAPPFPLPPYTLNNYHPLLHGHSMAPCQNFY